MRVRSAEAANQPISWAVQEGSILHKQDNIPFVAFSRRMEDTVVPKFKERSAKGEIFNNPMSKTETQFKVKKATVSGPELDFDLRQWGGGKFNYPSLSGDIWFEPVNLFVPDVKIDTSRVEVLAATKAKANVDAADFASFVSLGEAKSTIDWFLSIFTRAIQLYRSLKKGSTRILKDIDRLNGSDKREYLSSKAYQAFMIDKRKKLAKAYEDLENLRMEYRYAVRPLLADMEGLAKALHGTIRTPRQTWRGFAKDEQYVTTSLQDRKILLLGKTFKLEGTVVDKVTIESRAGILTQIDLDVLSSSSRKFGLGQSISAIYDLLPLSFALDWFINMGDFLSSLEPKAGVSTLSQWIVTTTSIERTLNADAFRNEKYRYNWNLSDGTNVYDETKSRRINVSGLTSSYTKTRKTRRPMTSSDISIRFDVNLDFMKILDLVTIARNLLK